jgi:hypothetical protein
VTAAPLVADFHATVHNLVTQPAYPDISVTHQTPWTFLAPKLVGRGSSTIVGGGPVRASTLVLAAGLGWLVQRWRTRPEMIVWTVALALALRTYTESVMTAYYVWPALAVGLVAAARGVRIRFAAAVVAALGTTVLVQQSLSLFVWWTLTVLGVTAVLVASAWPVPVAAPDVTTRPRQVRGAVTRARPTGQRKKSSKATGSGRRSAGVR